MNAPKAEQCENIIFNNCYENQVIKIWLPEISQCFKENYFHHKMLPPEMIPLFLLNIFVKLCHYFNVLKFDTHILNYGIGNSIPKTSFWWINPLIFTYQIESTYYPKDFWNKTFDNAFLNFYSFRINSFYKYNELNYNLYLLSLAGLYERGTHKCQCLIIFLWIPLKIGLI